MSPPKLFVDGGADSDSDADTDADSDADTDTGSWPPDVCDDASLNPISLPADLPYSTTDSTCGANNDYDFD